MGGASLVASAAMLVWLGCGAATDIDTTSDALRASCDGAAGKSTPADGHTHDICIAQAQLETLPVNGVVDITTVTDDHTHTVTLSQDDLWAISVGQSVGVETSVTLGHSHAFVLQVGSAASSTSSSASSGASSGQFGY